MYSSKSVERVARVVRPKAFAVVGDWIFLEYRSVLSWGLKFCSVYPSTPFETLYEIPKLSSLDWFCNTVQEAEPRIASESRTHTEATEDIEETLTSNTTAHY